MNLQKYSERVRGFLQNAQTYALGEGHPQFTAEHVLKALLDDEQGMAASLIDRAGGDSKIARLANDEAIRKLPKTSGGNGQLSLAQPLARIFNAAEDAAKKVGAERSSSRTCMDTERGAATCLTGCASSHILGTATCPGRSSCPDEGDRETCMVKPRSGNARVNGEVCVEEGDSLLMLSQFAPLWPAGHLPTCGGDGRQARGGIRCSALLWDLEEPQNLPAQTSLFP